VAFKGVAQRPEEVLRAAGSTAVLPRPPQPTKKQKPRKRKKKKKGGRGGTRTPPADHSTPPRPNPPESPKRGKKPNLTPPPTQTLPSPPPCSSTGVENPSPPHPPKKKNSDHSVRAEHSLNFRRRLFSCLSRRCRQPRTGSGHRQASCRHPPNPDYLHLVKIGIRLVVHDI